MTQTFTSFQEFKGRYPIRPNDKGALLGSGSYGRVIKVEDQLETEWVAIKISEFKGNDTKSLKAEVDLAQRLPRQANIARYDACYRLETDTSVSDFAIMKYYADGNLADLLQREKLTPAQLYDITRGILLGLQHLHKHRIVHRDFKPANILISRDNAGRFIPKIADFGLSKLVSDDELDSSDFDLSDGRGTPSYKAPEQIEGSRVSFNLDLWAFGVILYEMLTGEKPFRADSRNVSEQSIRREIEKKIITVDLPERLSQIPQPYRAMIERCLVHDIHERVRKEAELLDLLDAIPQLLAEANELLGRQDYEQAIVVFEQVLSKRQNHAIAEAGIAQCRESIDRREIGKLLLEATNFLTLQEFERAKDTFELILIRDKNNVAARQGRDNCLEQLKPKSVDLFVAEATDVYEEQTDIYVTPPAPKILETAPKPVENVALPAEPPAEKPKPISPKQHEGRITQHPASASPKPNMVPWKIAIPAAVVIGLGVLYNSFSGKTSPIQKGSIAPVTKAEVPPRSDEGKNIAGRDEENTIPMPSPNGGKEKVALTKRIDVAMAKARQLFRQKEYASVVELTSSALYLDPTRQDAIDLRNAAEKANQNKESVAAASTTPAQPVTTPETKAPEPEPAKVNTVSARQQAQDSYDQLIDEGMKAITGSNNKAQAIDKFNSARALAKDQDVNTAKGDAAFSYSLNKGKSYFEREEFDGAKAWFLVAQSIKDTEEVRRKIKQCTDQ